MNKTQLTLACISLIAVSASAENATKGQVEKAAQKLAKEENYSWTTSTKEADGSSGRLGTIEGKTDKEKLVFLSFSPGGIPVEVYMKGEKGAAKALEGWQTFDEISETSGTAAAIVRYLRSYKTPAEQAAELAGKAKELKEKEGAISGDLNEDAIKELLLMGARRREGQEAPKTSDANGSVKFWVKDGVLNKYEIHIEGKVTSGDRVSEINRTLTVEIKDSGATKLEVPDDAKAKMS